MYQQNKNQDFLANAARTLYGGEKQKEQEQNSLRNSLLNDLDGKLTPAQTLYSSVDDLKKMKENLNSSHEKFKGNFLSAPDSIEQIKETSKTPPLPTAGIKSKLSQIQNKEPELDLSHKPQLLGKIPTRKEELVVSAKFAPDDWDKNNEIPVADYKENKSVEQIDNSIFSDDAIIKARNFIQNGEGFKENAYQDTGGVWTIGYGHTKNVKPQDKITKEEAEKLYKEDFKAHSAYLKHVKVPLNDNEKIALASLIYNIGPNAFQKSTLLKKLNAGDKKGAAEEFNRWIYDNGKIQPGLVNRRKKEKDLFTSAVKE